MINSNPNMKKTLSNVKKTMVGIKNSAKNGAILMNKEALCPQLTGKCGILAKFNKIHEELVKENADEDADFEMDKSPSFKQRTEKVSSILSTIKVTTKALQIKENKLCHSWVDLEMLVNDINPCKNNPEHKPHKWKLKDVYIEKNSAKQLDPEFARRVENLQLELLRKMTEEERSSCFILREETVGADELGSAMISIEKPLCAGK